MREREAKYRGKIRITKEMMEHIFNVPNGIQIIGGGYDSSREIFNFILSSKEETEGITYSTGEGQEILDMNADLLSQWMKERFLELASNINKMKLSNEELTVFLKEE